MAQRFFIRSMQKKSQDLKLLKSPRLNRFQSKRDFLKCVLIAQAGWAFFSAIRLGKYHQVNYISRVINFYICYSKHVIQHLVRPKKCAFYLNSALKALRKLHILILLSKISAGSR